MKEALLYNRSVNNFVDCSLCAHRCKIAEGKFGFCGVRQNISGKLYSHVYARPVAMHVDPIEKKPLYHFLPGSKSFSIATAGCNFHCGFCQNWQISQQRAIDKNQYPGKEVAAQEIVQAALNNKCRSISYTYTEPTIFFEYALDTARLAKENGLSNVFVTNGYMTAECLEMIHTFLDAANVDLKFFKDESYRKICSATLAPVLGSIRLMHKLGIWVEVTTLIIPGENDSDQELRQIADFIASVDKNIPWHISRFHPDYKFSDYEITAEQSLKKAMEIGRQCGLKYIYAGNVTGWGNDTYCASCRKLLIKREVFDILEYNIKDGKCIFCQTALAGANLER